MIDFEVPSPGVSAPVGKDDRLLHVYQQFYQLINGINSAILY
jgi:hypothetical protein